MSNETSSGPAQPLTSHKGPLRPGESESTTNQLRDGPISTDATWLAHKSGGLACTSSECIRSSAYLHQTEHGHSWRLRPHSLACACAARTGHRAAHGVWQGCRGPPGHTAIHRGLSSHEAVGARDRGGDVVTTADGMLLPLPFSPSVTYRSQTEVAYHAPASVGQRAGVRGGFVHSPHWGPSWSCLWLMYKPHFAPQAPSSVPGRPISTNTTSSGPFFSNLGLQHINLLASGLSLPIWSI